MKTPRALTLSAVLPSFAFEPGLTHGRSWSKLRQDKAGLLGLAIVAVFLFLSLGVLFGWLGQGWSVADGGQSALPASTRGLIVTGDQPLAERRRPRC